jgi:hypothetical protein
MSVLSSNILHIIAECLSYQDLTTFAQLNRIANTVASRPELWRRECLRLFVSELDLFG